MIQRLAQQQRGNISLVFLMVSLALAAVAHIQLLWYGNELRAMEKYMEDTQKRLLMDSVFAIKAVQQWDEGQYVWYESEADSEHRRPSMKLVAESKYNEDKRIHTLECTMESANNQSAVLHYRRTDLVWPAYLRELSQNAALCTPVLYGEQFVSSAGIYKQLVEEVNLPDMTWLYRSGRVFGDVDLSEALSHGFRNDVYRLNKRELNIPAKSTIYGNTVIFTNARVNLGNSCKVKGNLVIFNEEQDIVIGDNVQIDKALLVSKGRITFGTGCKLKGLAYANSIRLKGRGTFTPDAEVTKPFSSASIRM